MVVDKQNHLLILGEYATGKTTYGRQLYERLKARKGSLRLLSAPKDISPFSDPLKRIAGGTSPEHTPSSVYHEIMLTVSTLDQQVIELAWPDYGGEQITSIISTRRVNETWLKRLSNSVGWVLFIRLSSQLIYASFLTEPVSVNTTPYIDEQDDNLSQSWSSAAALIELLQMFLYAKGVGTAERVTKPSLLILLSCWDEMDKNNQEQLPAELLKDHLPLFYEFVNTTWQPDSFSVWGLSSTGARLDAEEANENYMDYGPQEFGYIIQPDGTRRDDLTLPLLNLMGQNSWR
jgi:hypothetical protein